MIACHCLVHWQRKRCRLSGCCILTWNIYSRITKMGLQKESLPALSDDIWQLVARTILSNQLSWNSLVSDILQKEDGRLENEHLSAQGRPLYLYADNHNHVLLSESIWLIKRWGEYDDVMIIIPLSIIIKCHGVPQLNNGKLHVNFHCLVSPSSSSCKLYWYKWLQRWRKLMVLDSYG